MQSSSLEVGEGWGGREQCGSVNQPLRDPTSSSVGRIGAPGSGLVGAGIQQKWDKEGMKGTRGDRSRHCESRKMKCGRCSERWMGL